MKMNTSTMAWMVVVLVVLKKEINIKKEALNQEENSKMKAANEKERLHHYDDNKGGPYN